MEVEVTKGFGPTQENAGIGSSILYLSDPVLDWERMRAVADVEL